MATKRNAGYYSGRKTKKRVKAHGYNYMDYPKPKGELKRARKAKKVANPSYRVFDDRGKKLTALKSKKVAVYMARAASGFVMRGGKTVYSAVRNPIGTKWVTVKAKRKPNGQIELRRAR